MQARPNGGPPGDLGLAHRHDSARHDSARLARPRAVAVAASVLRLRRVGAGSYRPAVAACSRTTSPAGSTGTCSRAAPDSALAACTHLAVRSRFISAIRRANSK